MKDIITLANSYEFSIVLGFVGLLIMLFSMIVKFLIKIVL